MMPSSAFLDAMLMRMGVLEGMSSLPFTSRGCATGGISVMSMDMLDMISCVVVSVLLLALCECGHGQIMDGWIWWHVDTQECMRRKDMLRFF